MDNIPPSEKHPFVEIEDFDDEEPVKEIEEAEDWDAGSQSLSQLSQSAKTQEVFAAVSSTNLSFMSLYFRD